MVNSFSNLLGTISVSGTRAIAAHLTAAAIIAFSHGAAAEQGTDASDWSTASYPYLIVDQSLEDTLNAFGQNVGVRTHVSPRLDGRVRQYRHDGTAGAFLEKLSADKGFEWFFDGKTLHLSASDETVERSWSVGAASEAALVDALVKSGADDPRYPHRFDPAAGIMRLAGPPRYMAIAAPVIDRLLAPKATRTVNIIHGRSRAGGS